MNNVFFNAVMGAQVSDGLVRIKLGAGERAADGTITGAEQVTELVMPIRTFTDFANATQRIGAELVQRGVLTTSGDANQVPPQKADGQNA
jgi:hypothetical protein